MVSTFHLFLPGQLNLTPIRVYNILAHEYEADKILYEDPSPTDGFIIVPDLKWDGTTMATFYIQAIVHTRDIRSLRDIRKRPTQ